MRSVLFEIGGFTLYSYGAMLLIAFMIGIIFTLREAPRKGFNVDYLYEAYIISIILAVFGSRITYIFLNWEYYEGEPFFRTLVAREAGLTFYGGLIAVMLGLLVHCHYRRVPFFKLMDFAAPFIALGYGITRIGCFLNGCCYGHVTTVTWAVTFPLVDSLPRHPTQLYAVFAGLFIFVILRYMRKYSFFEGYIFLFFFVFYGIYRFINEFFRVSEPVLWGLTPAQFMALFFIIAALAFYFWKKKVLLPLQHINKNKH